METNALFSMMKSVSTSIAGFNVGEWSSDSIVAFGVFYKKGNKENILFIENTIKATTSLSAKATQYPVETGYNQTEFKYKEPNKVRLTGVISRKGTGVLGMNFSISSLALSNPLKSKQKIITETRKDLDYLIRYNVLCEVWTLNGGKRSYMTLTKADIFDDLQHTGLYEVDLEFVEVQELILEPEPTIGALSSKLSTGICQVMSKVV